MRVIRCTRPGRCQKCHRQIEVGAYQQWDGHNGWCVTCPPLLNSSLTPSPPRLPIPCFTKYPLLPDAPQQLPDGFYTITFLTPEQIHQRITVRVSTKESDRRIGIQVGDDGWWKTCAFYHEAEGTMYLIKAFRDRPELHMAACFLLPTRWYLMWGAAYAHEFHKCWRCGRTLSQDILPWYGLGAQCEAILRGIAVDSHVPIIHPF